jgi:aminoglycoside 3-N-acetyltransferase
MEGELSYREWAEELRALGLTPDVRANVIAHVSLEAFGEVQGGAHALLGGLLTCVETLVMPAFTFQTMVVPEYGPPDNGIVYGQATERNAQAVPFHYELPVHASLGKAPEVLRTDNQTLRSVHPALSFVAQGRYAYQVLDTQTATNPFGPVEWLEFNNGFVLLMGVGQRQNVSLHLAAQRAGRQGFVRWALTPEDVIELPGFPGCSDGFGAIASHLRPITRRRDIGLAAVQLIPLREMLAIAEGLIANDPYALLCQRATCERCRAREPR